MADPNLDAILDSQNKEREKLRETIDAGTAAKSDLGRLQVYIDLLEAAKKARDQTKSSAAARKEAASKQAEDIQGSDKYKAAKEAASKLPGDLTDAKLQEIVNKIPEPPVSGKDKYSDYTAALAKAESDLASGKAAIASGRLAMARAKLGLDQAAAPVLEAVVPMEGLLTGAKAGVAESAQRKPSDPARAWWSMQKADTLFAKLKDPTTGKALETATAELDKACNDYADAIAKLAEAEKALPGLQKARDEAAANLESAEVKVIAALAEKIKSAGTEARRAGTGTGTGAGTGAGTGTGTGTDTGTGAGTGTDTHDPS